MNTSYDMSITCIIQTVDQTFTQFFNTDWKIPDILDYMKNTYLIDDSVIISQSIQYTTRYKIKK